MADVMINLNDIFDFSQGAALKKLETVMIKGDANAHKISVTCKRSGTPVDLSGMTFSGLLVNSKKHNVPATGLIAGSVASLEFPASWYAVQGPALVMLQLSSGTTDTTIFYAYTTVQDGATDVYYDPDSIIPTLAQIAALIAEIETGGGVVDHSNDPLYGKTLVHCGDSISAGPWIDPDPDTGVVPTFPVVAGARHGMTVHNTAISGAWLVHTNYHGTPAPYPLIDMIDGEGFLPASIDYITFMMGGNDEYGLEGLYDEYCLTHYSALYGACTAAQQAEARAAVPISNFIGLDWHHVNYTWWGCWNLILTHIRTNYPNAVIGLITPLLSDPINDPFQAALRSSLYAIAKKYGCAIRDSNNGDEWFSWGWTDGIGTDEAAALKTLYTTDTIHPNAAAHVKMADKYEGWLMSGLSGYGREPEYPKYYGEIKPKQGLYDAIADQFNGLLAGRNLATLFPTFASMMASIDDGSFRNIRVGDYWDATLNGSYRDPYYETCPSGVTYYSDEGLTTAAGTTGQAYNATYIDATKCSISISGTTVYVATGSCLGYREMAVNGFTFRGQIATINPFIGHFLTKNHVVICGQYLFPHSTAMRRVSAVWHNASAQNSWLGSSLYAAMNDATHGIIRLFDGTTFEDYIYPGAGNGIVFPMEQKYSNSWNAENLYEVARGKLFLPLEHEVFGTPLYSSRAYGCGLAKQWELFRVGKDTIRKLVGSTPDTYWLQSAQEGTPYGFCGVSSKGLPTSIGDNTYWISFPVCFILAVPD